MTKGYLLLQLFYVAVMAVVIVDAGLRLERLNQRLDALTQEFEAHVAS